MNESTFWFVLAVIAAGFTALLFERIARHWEKPNDDDEVSRRRLIRELRHIEHEDDNGW